MGQPKTASGRRSIALPAAGGDARRKHRAHQNAERLGPWSAWQDRGFVFTNETGGPLHVNNLVARVHWLVDAVGVPPIRFHHRRHTCATLLLAEGVRPKIVRERLGHADISMTRNRSGHVTPGMQQQAADAIDAAMEAAAVS